MYRDRVGGGGGSSRSEIVGVPLDRKCIINDALDKHLEKSSPSNSRVGGLNSSSKDKERLSVPSTSTGKSQQQLDHRDSRSASLSKNKCSMVTGNPIPGLDNHAMNPVIECDLYGDPTIWMNIFEETGMKCLYFYTKLKIKKKMGKKSNENNGNRVERSTEWGTWRGQSDGKVCQNRIHVGSKRSFTYGAKKGFNANNSGWVMYEYRLDGIYGNHPNQHNYVICMIKKKSGKQKGNGMNDTSTTSNLKQEDVQPVQQMFELSNNGLTPVAHSTTDHSYNGLTLVLPHSTTDQQMFEQYSNINGLLAPHSTKDAEDDYYLTEEELEELMSSPDLDTSHDAFTSLTQLLA